MILFLRSLAKCLPTFKVFTVGLSKTLDTFGKIVKTNYLYRGCSLLTVYNLYSCINLHTLYVIYLCMYRIE